MPFWINSPNSDVSIDWVEKKNLYQTFNPQDSSEIKEIRALLNNDSDYIPRDDIIAHVDL